VLDICFVRIYINLHQPSAQEYKIMTLIKYSDIRTQKVELNIFCDVEVEHFGFATKGLKPQSMPFKSNTEAQKAARKMVKNAVNEAIANQTLTIDSNLFFS